MPYSKCKVYSDGSHYIAIPYIPQKPRHKKRKSAPSPEPELEMEIIEDEGPTPFDKFEQMSLFDEISAKKKGKDRLSCVRSVASTKRRNRRREGKYSSGCIRSI